MNHGPAHILGRPQINIADLPQAKCQNEAGCDSVYFAQVLEVRVLSALKSPSRKEEWLTVPHQLVCIKCGTVLKKVT